jgi:copper oxidase (laccase) domain-containing protein
LRHRLQAQLLEQVILHQVHRDEVEKLNRDNQNSIQTFSPRFKKQTR